LDFSELFSRNFGTKDVIAEKVMTLQWMDSHWKSMEKSYQLGDLKFVHGGKVLYGPCVTSQ